MIPIYKGMHMNIFHSTLLPTEASHFKKSYPVKGGISLNLIVLLSEVREIISLNISTYI